MKALNIDRCFAMDIACGEKTEENRSWSTKHRGPLLIVANKEKGHITEAVAVVQVVDCIGEKGDWAFMLDDIRPIKPFPVRGKLGLYDFPIDESKIEYLGPTYKAKDAEDRVAKKFKDRFPNSKTYTW